MSTDSLDRKYIIPYQEDVCELKHYPHICIVRDADIDRLVRDEFRLCRHDRSSRRRLRKFVDRSVALEISLDVGNDKRLHEFFDECGFPRAYGSDDPDINVSVGARRYIPVNIRSRHSLPPKISFW